MSKGKLFINCYPAGKYGMETQARRLGRECLYLPGSFDYDEIEEQLKKLTDTLGLPELTEDERKQERQSCEQALAKAKDLIKDMPITLDYLFHPRPLGLAKLLLTHGFQVKSVFLDSISPEEKEDFIWLKENSSGAGADFHCPSGDEGIADRQQSEKILAIGQKAAWFTGSRNFVNMVQGGGLWGFDGIRHTAQLMVEAFHEEKDPEDLIVRKGMGVRKLHMRQAYRIIPIYTADVSGVCSALYELGGMTVMHDPSGCNSTYNTHDEIRWYDQDSLIFISGLTDIDAIMGNDEKFLQDIEDAAKELKPKFIALASSPIPFMNGTDFPWTCPCTYGQDRDSGVFGSNQRHA